jgi:hypothetical protein
MTRQKLMRPFTAGEFITISTGSYSDYSVEGVFKVACDFDPNEITKKFINDYIKPRVIDDAYSEDDMNRFHYYWGVEEGTLDFYAWLIQEGYLELIDSRQWHLGDSEFATPYEDD